MKAFVHHCVRLFGLLCILTASATAQQLGTLYVKHSGAFSAVSDDQNRAVTLAANLPQIRQWICRRWGLPTKDLSLECRVFCMSSEESLNRNFRIPAPAVDIRKDIYVMYIAADDNYVNIVPFFLTTVCLKDMERQYGVHFGFWLYRGMGTLNCTNARIRAKLEFLRGRSIHPTQNILSMTEAEWAKQPMEAKAAYDAEASVLCLAIFRDIGKKKFLEFIGTQDMQKSLGVTSLDPVFGKYLTKVMTASDYRYLQLL